MKVFKILFIIFFITAPFIFAGKEEKRVAAQTLALLTISGIQPPDGVDPNEWDQYENAHPACYSCLKQFEDPEQMKEHIKKCCAELLSHN